MGRCASSQEFLRRRNNEWSLLKSSTCQLRTDPPFDIGTPKAPELADLHAANLAVSCHSLQRLGVNPQNRGGLIAVQHPLYAPFDMGQCRPLNREASSSPVPFLRALFHRSFAARSSWGGPRFLP